LIEIVMDIGSIFLILGLLILVGLFISRPLFEPERDTGSYTSQREHQVSTLMAERDRLLDAIQELDFDHVLGKIPEEDYPTQRASLLQRGANVLRELDGITPEPAAEKVEDRLEAAISARKATIAAPAGQRRVRVGTDDAFEQMIANRRRERNEKSAGFCPNCGGPLQKSDRFCPKCGTEIS
jgi:zinc-ribbon domain